jgi:hypothetical protein
MRRPILAVHVPVHEIHVRIRLPRALSRIRAIYA